MILTLPPGLSAEGMGQNERGGILLGHGARIHRYTTPGPLDIGLPGMFMLLDPCHQTALDRSGLDYLGFWHTHPPGTPSDYSPEDLTDWHASAAALFPQIPAAHLCFVIVTGDRVRAWALARDLTLTELRPEEVNAWI